MVCFFGWKLGFSWEVKLNEKASVSQTNLPPACGTNLERINCNDYTIWTHNNLHVTKIVYLVGTIETILSLFVLTGIHYANSNTLMDI